MSQETLDKSAATGTTTASKKPYDPEELIGTTLAGRYEIVQCIGKGGMGVVYLASQRALGRNVVIKVLPRSFVDDTEALGRFEREARGMSRLQHPNIVAIYDFGEHEDLAFICMEYVAGETLNQRIKREGPIPVGAFAAIAAQILQGIGEAHSMGLIHRDIKPSNIMLTERHGQTNYVKILDFGLAKLMKGAAEVTKEQALVGSTSFLSPEQILGHEIDHRVDIYAMGVLFYYMLCGEKPFTADEDIRVLYLHVHNEPPPLADKLPPGHEVPDALSSLIERMLAKSPESRPPDAPSLLKELGEILLDHAIQLPEDVAVGSTGDFPRVTQSLNQASRSADDPSEQLARVRANTPTHSTSAATPSGHQPMPPWDVDSNSFTHTGFITGEQLREIQKAQSRNTLTLLLVAVLLIVGGVIGALWYFDSLPMQDKPSEAPVASSKAPSEEALIAQLDEASALIEDENLGLAEDILNLVQPALADNPSLNSRYAAARDRLGTARLLLEAESQEKAGASTEALGTYEKLLRRSPNHADAQAAVERLKAELKHAEAQKKEQEKRAASQDKPGEEEQEEARPRPKRAARNPRPSPPKPATPKKEEPAEDASEDDEPRRAAPAAEDEEDINLLPVDEPLRSPSSDDDDDSAPLLDID